MPDIFLSYSRDDQATARRFAEGLEREGFSVWWDATLHSGDAYDQVTEKALREAKAVVVLWSKKSVDSRWVRAEATTADRNKTLVPVMIESCNRPIMFELTHTADLSHWKGDSGDKVWKTYVADVHRMVQRGEPVQAVPQAASRPNRSARFGGARSIATLAAVVIIAGGIVWAVSHTGSMPATATTGAASSATNSATPPIEPRTSIAVMPFANLTGDPSKDYLGDGMSEELLNVLAKVPGLKVPSRTSSFAYKGRNTDLKQIASDLHVGTILEGSVRSAGETIRVTAQLINAQTDTHLWSETYDRKFTDLFQLQDELAKAIVQAMQVNLNGAAPASVAQAPPTQDVEAYRLYLQGVSVYSRFSEKAMREGIALLKQALDRDPGFARAWADLGIAHLGAVRGGYPLPNALQDAEQEATRALALDPGLVNGSLVLGSVSAYRGDWIKADALYRAAIARDGGNPIIRYARANDILESVGQLRLALEEANVAYRLAPVDTSALVALSAVHSMAGHDAEAIHYLDLLLQLGFSPDVTPLPQIRANALTRSGRYREAGERMLIVQPARMREAGGDAVIRAVYAALDEPRKKPSAVAALQALLKKLKAEDIDVNARKALIATFVQLDALDEAFQLANQTLDFYALSKTVGSAWGVLWLPEMRPFRRDPRFQPFVTRMGLMEYWKQYGPPDDCDLKDGKLSCH